nr:hypothetical protein [Tanacetum cinerariifolium]
MKYAKGIAKNVLVTIGKFVFPIDFIIPDMPEDIKVPLILGRPFLSTARAKIDVYKKKITLRVREEKIVFTSVKAASSLIKRVYMLSLRERMEFYLEARLMGETLVLNRSLDPFFEDYIELNDLNEPIKLRRNQGDDLMPIIKEGEHFKTLSLDELRSPNFNLLSDQEYSKEEVSKTMAETMEQYISKTRANYGSGDARSKIEKNDNFKLKGQFLKELRTNTFSGSDHEDANEHIEKVIEIVDIFYIPNIIIDQLMLSAFPMSLTGAKWHNGTSKSRSTETSDGLAAIQAQLNNLGRGIKKVNEKVYVAQVGCEQCKGPHYTKDCPLKEEGKTLKEAYYTQFGGPFQGGGYKAATLAFYQRNNVNPLPFLSTAHAKIDVYKKKITLRVREEKIVFTSVKASSSLIKRVYMLSLRERMEFYLEARLMGETLVLNRSLDPFFEDYIELNDLNEPIKLRRNQGDDLMPTIKEVILNGDAPAAIASVSGGVEATVPPKTTAEKIAWMNELKAKSTLLLGIPDEHILKFHEIKDAKTLWEAIKTRFEGNKEFKKMQKTILKQQYENFVASRFEGLDKTYDRF